jgi:formylglycine-generating enzyme required for sulfatase activity
MLGSTLVGLVWLLVGCTSEPPQTVLWGADLAVAADNGGIQLQPGVFLMGSPKSEDGRYPPEQLHEVKLTRSFWILQTEVTQELYERVMGKNPAKHVKCGPTCPVEEVSFFDAINFCNRLSEIEGLAPAYTLKGQQVVWHWGSPGYRLLTEAEWEYAARSGGKNRGALPGGGPPSAIAWHNANARGSTHPSKELRPNELDLYDMGGNVREWTWDFPSYFGPEYAIDPTGPATGTERMTRGGSWTADLTRVRNAYRRPEPPKTSTPQIGFRIARTALQ